MNLRTYFFVAIITGISTLGFSQKNISKAGAFPGVIWKVFSVSQERQLTKRISTQTTVRAMPPIKFPLSGLTAASYKDQAYNPFSEAKLFGIGNVTEFRIYGKDKEKTMRGFYWGPYFTAMVYKLKSATYPAEFHDANNVVYTADIQHVVKLSTIGGGMQIGVQGMIKDLVAFDWTILGIGFGSLGLSGGIEATNTSNNFDFRNYEEDVNKAVLGYDKYLPLKKTVEKESVGLGIKVPYPLFRMAISIGIAY
jgi:hypothetical protein